MTDKEFLRKFVKMDFSQNQTPFHQRRLKNALLKMHIRQQSFFRMPIFISNLEHMSFLKKLVSTVAVMFVVASVLVLNQNNSSTPQIAHARQILTQALEHVSGIETSQQKIREERELILSLLLEALSSSDLKYLGEEIREDGQKIKVLSFQDASLSYPIFIYVDSANFFANQGVVFTFQSSNYPLQNIKIPLKHEQTDFNHFHKRLTDTKLHKELIRKLIHYKNEYFTEMMIAEMKLSFFKDDQQKFKEFENFLGKIRPVLENSDFLLQGYSINDARTELTFDFYEIISNSKHMPVQEGVRKNLDQEIPRIISAFQKDKPDVDGLDPEIKEKIFIFPTKGKITHRFYRGHAGIDIANENQPSILAAAGGKVIKIHSGCPPRFSEEEHAENNSACGDGHGNFVVLDHGQGLTTFYAHLATVSVAVGDEVIQGQVLGDMGSSGIVFGKTGIHLHFEVRDKGVPKDPLNYYK